VEKNKEIKNKNYYKKKKKKKLMLSQMQDISCMLYIDGQLKQIVSVLIL